MTLARRSQSSRPAGSAGSGPRAGRSRPGLLEPAADAGVEDAGDVAGAGQAPGRGRLAQGLTAVQAAGLGFAQGAPQPGARRIVQCRACEVGGECVAERLLEPVTLRPAGEVVPDAAEHAQ